jgi:hypothetical protein
MEEAIDALGSDLSIRLSRREEIPAPSAAKRGQRLVSVPLWLAPKLALYLAMRDQQVNNSERRRLSAPGAAQARNQYGGGLCDSRRAAISCRGKLAV